MRSMTVAELAAKRKIDLPEWMSLPEPGATGRTFGRVGSHLPGGASGPGPTVEPATALAGLVAVPPVGSARGAGDSVAGAPGDRTETGLAVGAAVAPGPERAASPAAAPAPSPAGDDTITGRFLVAVALALAAVGAAWLVAVHAISDQGYDPASAARQPVEGLTIFAVFFVAAAGIERLLEPFATLASRAAKVQQQEAEARADHRLRELVAAEKRLKELADRDEADPAVAEAAGTRRAALDELIRAMEALAPKTRAAGLRASDVKLFTWAVASAIGILVASACQLYLLQRVGIASAPRALEVGATGLIIGSGTKPMHDLVSYMEKRKEAAAGS